MQKDDYSGRNVHYGVREHGMGAIVNGLCLHGLKAFGSTFFNFSDYMKGAMRLASIMHLPAIFVFTHDSIGLGEDGPTHQPVEQLAHLRATPNHYVVRPGRCERDRAGLALRDRADLDARCRSSSAARACRSGTRPACPATRSTAAPTCCASPTRTPSPT